MENGAKRRNKNRGYQQLRVRQDAIALYVLVCKCMKGWPFELKKVASQEIASVDSIHRNIAEGYARRSIREYLNFLNIARGSAGESVSGFFAYRAAEQISEPQFEELDSLAYRLENGLLKLIESLERKGDDGSWEDSLVIQESNTSYG
jgi:four helix bundle protein